MPQQSWRQVGKAAMNFGREGQSGQAPKGDGRTEPTLINVDS